MIFLIERWEKITFSFTNDSISLFTNDSHDNDKVFCCKLIGNGCTVKETS